MSAQIITLHPKWAPPQRHGHIEVFMSGPGRWIVQKLDARRGCGEDRIFSDRNEAIRFAWSTAERENLDLLVQGAGVAR